MLESALAKAQSQEKRGHEAELLVRLGRLAAQTGNRQQALTYLEDAGQFATKVQFYRMEADAMFELATTLSRCRRSIHSGRTCHSGRRPQASGW